MRGEGKTKITLQKYIKVSKGRRSHEEIDLDSNLKLLLHTSFNPNIPLTKGKQVREQESPRDFEIHQNGFQFFVSDFLEAPFTGAKYRKEKLNAHLLDDKPISCAEEFCRAIGKSSRAPH
jgi:hypothetical protein